MTSPDPDLPLHIDSTMMTCFRGCPQKYRKEFILGKRPAGLSIDLHAGACFALALEHTYRGVWEKGLSLDLALERSAAAFSVAWGDFEIPETKNTPKTFERVWQAVVDYFAKWHPKSDHIPPFMGADGKPTIEYTFSIPLEPAFDPSDPDGFMGFPLHPSGSPFLYCGRFDMLGVLDGRPVVRDEKTTKYIGQDWAESFDLRSQFIGYTWACQQMGLDVDSVVVRGVAITKTKETNLQEAIKTYSNEMRARWLEQLRRDLWRLRRCWDAGYFDYNMGDTCTAYGNCVFLTSCVAPPEQEASWLAHFTERHWNPTNRNPIA